MKHGNRHFTNEIKEARRNLAAAKSALRRAVRDAQSTCRHEKVLHSDGIRICARCGFEEQIDYGSPQYWGGNIKGPPWHPNLHSYKHVLRCEFIKVVERDRIWECRP